MWDLLRFGAFGPASCGWQAGISATRGRVVRVPTWLLVRTLWAVDRWRVVSFFFALLSPSGFAVWLGAGGYVGASDRMIAVAVSRVLAFFRPRDCSSGARELCDGG